MVEIILISDDLPNAKYLKQNLAGYQIDVTICQDVGLGSRLAQQSRFRVILLDVGLLNQDNFAICSNIRKQGIDTPVLILHSHSNVQTLTKAVNVEADGIVTKPVNLMELNLRIVYLVKRTPHRTTKVIEHAELLLNYDSWELFCKDQLIPLRRKELQVLALLLENQNRVLTREQILNFTSDIGCDADCTVIDVHISNIRKQLKPLGKAGIIQTIHGVGYAIKSVLTPEVMPGNHHKRKPN